MSEIKINKEHTGGNIRIVSLDYKRAVLEQEMRDSTKWWFYWNFCAEGAAGTEVFFDFTNGEVIGPWGPAFSKDGISWEWLGKDSLVYENETRRGFRYTFGNHGDIVYFSFSLPYQMHHFERFYQRHRNNSILTRKVLAVSEKGREVPILSFGRQDAEKHIIFTCRHHACEASASYLLEGLMDFLKDFGNCSGLGNLVFHIVPFVDIDGVEEGDQGKGRHPHDHNRDYTEKPLYRTVTAVKKLVESSNVIAGFDFHSPWKWGDRNDQIFFVKCGSPAKEEAEKLGRHLVEVTGSRGKTGDIVYTGSYDVDMGMEWNIPDQPTFSTYLFSRNVPLVCGLEFPYFGREDMMVTRESAWKFGRNFGKALLLYFMEKG